MRGVSRSGQPAAAREQQVSRQKVADQDRDPASDPTRHAASGWTQAASDRPMQNLEPGTAGGGSPHGARARKTITRALSRYGQGNGIWPKNRCRSPSPRNFILPPARLPGPSERESCSSDIAGHRAGLSLQVSVVRPLSHPSRRRSSRAPISATPRSIPAARRRSGASTSLSRVSTPPTFAIRAAGRLRS